MDEKSPCEIAPYGYCNNAEGCPCADYEEWIDKGER